MQAKNIAEHSAILSIFIKLPIVIKIFVLSIFERPLYTGCTVLKKSEQGWICYIIVRGVSTLHGIL